MNYFSIYILIIGPLLRFCLEPANSNHKIAAKASLVCVYRLTYLADSSDSKSIRSENFKLLIGDNISRFQSPSSRSRDSLTAILLAGADSHAPSQEKLNFFTKQVFSLPITSFRYVIYKTPSTGKIDYYDWIGSNLYQYTESTAQFRWTITQAKASFAGYSCQKATTSFAGRRFEAWFTREIPVSDGPYKFAGLPGLIIKVNDVGNQFAFELKKISMLVDSNIDLPAKKATLATRDAFNKGLATYQMSLQDRMASMGNTVSSDDRKNLAERAKKRNNRLELR